MIINIIFNIFIQPTNSYGGGDNEYDIEDEEYGI